MISQLVHKINLNKFFGLNQTEGVYFHPENGKIVITKIIQNHQMVKDMKYYTVCLVFQQIKLMKIIFLKLKRYVHQMLNNYVINYK